jgi:hypothetical protein
MADINEQIAAAYQAGDYGTTNNLISSANMTADQAEGIWGSGIAALAQQQGINFAPTTSSAPAAFAPPVVNATPVNPFDAGVSAYAAANPNATPYQASNIISQMGGLNPQLSDSLARQYGTTADYVNSTYESNRGINNLYNTYLGRAPESQAVVDQYIKQFGSTIDPTEIAAFRGAIAPELARTGYLSEPSKNEIQTYVNSVLTNKNLSYPEQVNQILNRAREVGVTQPQLESIYGKQNVQPFMDTYKTNINNFINTTLAKDTGTTMDEVGILHKAALDNKFTVDELVKYGGLDKATAQSYFDMYDKGIGSIVTGLLDPKTDDITKTKTALALAQQYGTTDAELAKASNGKLSEKEVKAYLDPVRNLVPNLQKMMTDNSYSAADVKKLLDESKSDPRTMGIYGSALNQVEQNLPAFLLRDVQNGNGSIADNYQKFLTQAKSTPEMAAKYAPQIQAVEKMLETTAFTANENFGGKPQDYQLQIVSPLSEKAKAGIPKILEFKPVKLETRDDGEGGTYQVQTGGGVKTKGVQEITSGDSDSGAGSVTGYRSTEPTTVNGLPVYATYDAAGKLTGYEADSRYRSWLNGKQSISGAFDANGQPKVQSHQSRGAGIRGFTQDIMSDSVLGPIASMAAAYFGGPAGIAALKAVQGVPIEDIAKSAALAYAGGQIAQGTTAATAGSLGEFGSQAAGQFAGNVGANLLSGQGVDVNNALINSVVNTGVNTGINRLLDPVDLNKLGSMRPYATGIASNVLSSAISGRDPNLQNALMKTAMQEAMRSGKTAARP